MLLGLKFSTSQNAKGACPIHAVTAGINFGVMKDDRETQLCRIDELLVSTGVFSIS
jgi:hypothetical protein